MRLELLVERGTPLAVVEHLAEGIQKSFRPITAVAVDDVRRYVLPRRRAHTFEETVEFVEQKIEHMRSEAPWEQGEYRIISPDEVDVMVLPSRSGSVNLRYHNLTGLLTHRQNKTGGSDKFVLVGTHHRFFNVYACADETGTSEITPSINIHDGWNDGFWSDWHNGGVAHLAKAPKPGNVWAAAHELGHALGLEHPHDLADRNAACVMRVDVSYARKGTLLDFCDPCINTIMRCLAK